MVNNVIICSKNPVKIQAVEACLPQYNIISVDCPSSVPEQPIGQEETLRGAINRTDYVFKNFSEVYMAIAFEAGIEIINEQPYVIQWAVVTLSTGKRYSVQGIGIELPQSFLIPLKQGVELSQLIDEYTGQQDIRSKNGALGVLTNDYITRQQLYEQMLNVILNYREINI